MHSGQAELRPAPKIIAGSLGGDRENKGFLSTTAFTFRAQGQAEGCPTFFFFFWQNCLKQYCISIIIFNVINGIYFVSCAAVTLLSLTFNSHHCTLPFHSPAQVHQSRPADPSSTTAQHSVVNWCRGQRFSLTAFTSAGRWHRRIWDTEESIYSEHLVGSDIHTDNMKTKWMQVSVLG